MSFKFSNQIGYKLDHFLPFLEVGLQFLPPTKEGQMFGLQELLLKRLFQESEMTDKN